MTTETSTKAIDDYVATLIANSDSLGDVRTALGLGTLATQNANAAVITGGSLSNVSIVASTLRVTGGPFTVGVDGAARANRLQLYGAASPVAWSPANQAIYAVGSYAGIGTGPYSVISIDDSVTNTQVGIAAVGMYIAHNIVAGAGAGNRTTLQPTLSKNAPTAGTNPLLKFYTPFFSQHYVNSGDGGTGISDYRGDHYGGASLLEVHAGGKWLETVQGFEIDVAMQANSSAKVKTGLLIASVNSDAVRGSQFDAMLCFTRDSTCVATWKHGVCFGYLPGLWPFANDSILIGTYGSSLPAGTGIDFSAVVFTTAAIKTPGFQVGTAGAVDAVAVNVNGGSGAAVVALKGNGSNPNKYLRAYNGSFELLNSANSVSLLSIDNSGNAAFAGGVSANALVASNTGVNGAQVALIGDGSTTPKKYLRANGGVFYILNDDLSASILTITDSGQVVLNMTGLKNAVDDAAAATAGVPTGGIYRNGSALQVRVT